MNILQLNTKIYLNLIKKYLEIKESTLFLNDEKRIFTLQKNNEKLNIFFDNPFEKAKDKREYLKTLKYWKSHPFHIVEESTLPISIAFLVYITSDSIVRLFEINQTRTLETGDFLIVGFGLSKILGLILGWTNTLQQEYSISLNYTEAVRKNLILGFLLFLLSEIFLFISVFWAFFYSMLNPSIFTGGIWPPMGIIPVSPFKVPLVNTLILVISGITVNAFYFTFKALFLTPVYHAFKKPLIINLNYLKHLSFFFHLKIFGFKRFFRNLVKIYIITPFLDSFYYRYFYRKIYNRKTFLNFIEERWNHLFYNLIVTILLGLLFLTIQIYEYIHAPFKISDGVYGSVFYMATGLHGFHVFVGLMMLLKCFFDLLVGKYSYGLKFNSGNTAINPGSEVGITITVWYWHFVDVIWLFLYIFMYVLGSNVNLIIL